MAKRIWLSWESHRRNQSLSPHVGACLFQQDLSLKGVRRYLYLIRVTINSVLRYKPSAIFAQNPSIVLSFLSILLGKYLQRPVIVDAHNIGIIFEHRNRIVRRFGQCLNQVIMRHADLIIVTNEALGRAVPGAGGRLFVLPDPIPEFTQRERKRLQGEKAVLYICSFGGDEPYLEVIKSASELKDGFVIYITGDFRRIKITLPIPSNVVLTGYVSEQQYLDYLFSCDVVMDLTYRKNCLVCGAYEAIAAEKPLILSDTPSLSAYFGSGAIFCKNEATDIARAIREVFSDIPNATSNVTSMKKNMSVEWDIRKKELLKIIDNLEGASKPEMSD